MQQIINDIKVPIIIDGQTIYVTAAEAHKLKAKLSKTAAITVENPSPPVEWRGKSLILE